MTKVEFAVTNDSHIIKHFKYDIDVLDSYLLKWTTKLKKIAPGWGTDDLCVIAGMTGDFTSPH